MASIQRHWPEAQRFIVLVDKDLEKITFRQNGTIVLRPSDLGIADFEQLAFANSPTGLCCLLKPYAALAVLARKHSTAAYFDSDTWLLRSPTAMIEALKNASVLLTPHALHPYPAGAVRSDTDLMRSGAFNAGFFAVCNDAGGRAFLQWWRDRLHQTGALEAAQQFDQSWLNLAPVLFPEVQIWRNPAYNVGFWNFSERQKQASTDTEEIVLLHLSLFKRERPDHFVFANWLRMLAPANLAGLLKSYAAELDLAGAAQFETLSYGFGQFSDGRVVTDSHRSFYRQRIFRREMQEGSPFSPEFRAGPYQGHFSLYRSMGTVPRAVRKLTGISSLFRRGIRSIWAAPKSPSASP